MFGGIGGMGVAPLMPSEIEAWARLTGRVLEVWESTALLQLDAVWLAAQSESHKPKAKA